MGQLDRLVAVTMIHEGVRATIFGMLTKLQTFTRDINAAAMWAGVTAFVWYAFGAVPLHIAVASQLGLTAAQSSSWIFIIWTSGAVASISLSVYYRMPVPITWSIPGLIYLGTLAGEFTFSEIAAANLVAGVLILVLGVLGVGGQIMRWLPLPIVMGMFAGSIFGYVTRLVDVTVGDVAVAGPAVGGYLVGRLIGNPRVPPVGLAVLFGAIAVMIGGQATPEAMSWSLPSIGVPSMTFSTSSILAISLPMVVLALGLGNVQGLGFLIGQGYKVPVNPISIVIGITSVINALLGGHPAIVARTGVAILAGPDAGPKEQRYWANLTAATLTLIIALAAGLVIPILAVLPSSYIFALAGLAIFASLQDAFQKAFSGNLAFGALVAFAVASTPFSYVGITSALWAVLAGLGASLIAERGQLRELWRVGATESTLG
ncbi:MAG: benzoate/H(+) symporter BenE family transporter [Chloroflexi bacterium]|nr:benzoate/H(+) symporter BenE family transporter [Chloroflexota bacterium]